MHWVDWIDWILNLLINLQIKFQSISAIVLIYWCWLHNTNKVLKNGVSHSYIQLYTPGRKLEDGVGVPDPFFCVAPLLLVCIAMVKMWRCMANTTKRMILSILVHSSFQHLIAKANSHHLKFDVDNISHHSFCLL